ncbi:protein gurken isoform X2 [Musca domestica]|uniref:Protein gurken isoform X2 n=1 Tax=Musca domestica TaxID=7370 RepID=A0ABM3V641_MUSDO|nr:protein gurken isoform X2 [Musca domestica]
MKDKEGHGEMSLDCCSSRILFLREQTFNIIQQHKMQQYQQQGNDQQQPANEKYEQHVYGGSAVSGEKVFNKNHTTINSDDESTSGDEQSTNDGSGTETSAHIDRPPPIFDVNSDQTLKAPPVHGEVITDESAREKIGEKSGYPVLDFYYSIMSHVLSIPCTGQFLTEFCLNGGRCFSYPIGNHSFFSCECADGYVGERCESKHVNGVYGAASTLDSSQPKILTARVVFSFPMLIFLTVTYLFFGMVIVFKCQSPLRYKTAPHTSRAAGLLCT